MGGSTRAAVTPLERALAHIFATLLDATELGVDDDFFRHCGDTETAADRIRVWLDIPSVTGADLAASRTVAALAETLRNRDARVEQVAELFLEVVAAQTVNEPMGEIRTDFASWIRRFRGPARGAIVLFPHAGSAAAAYRSVAATFAAHGPDVFVVQYPQHAGRLKDPAAPTITALAEGLYTAGPWQQVGPLQLFGHCMGSLVAFEFAKIAAQRGTPVDRLWVSGGAAPSSMAELLPLPTDDDEIIADITELGGTDPRLLADPEFVELLVPAVRADYQALNQYTSSPGDAIDVEIVVIGANRDDRVTSAALRGWKSHTSRGFDMHQLDGGHFFLFENIDDVDRIVKSYV